MFSIPLPFVISLLLVMLWIKLFLGNSPARARLLVFVALCSLLATLVGIRWTFNAPAIRLIQPVVASILPPLAWWCFSKATPERALHRWPLLIPVAFTVFTLLPLAGWNFPLDIALVALYLVYGIALCKIALSNADHFATIRLSDHAKMKYSVLLTGLILCFSGLSDTFIGLDYALFNGSHAALIITFSNVLVLPVLAFIVTFAPQSVPFTLTESGTEAEAISAAPQVDEVQLVEKLKTLIRDKALFLDPDLTLDRLSRKAVIPARHISQAVNHVLKCNVSQWMNSFRVEEACRLLNETDLPITRIIFESGFRTKSNFNREFLRQTGMNPGDYRRASAQGSPVVERP